MASVDKELLEAMKEAILGYNRVRTQAANVYGHDVYLAHQRLHQIASPSVIWRLIHDVEQLADRVKYLSEALQDATLKITKQERMG